MSLEYRIWESTPKNSEYTSARFYNKNERERISPAQKLGVQISFRRFYQKLKLSKLKLTFIVKER